MSVDVFGRKLRDGEGARGPRGIGFKVTADGHFDLENKRLCNVAWPKQLNEAVNLELVVQNIKEQQDYTNEIYVKLKTYVDEKFKDLEQKLKVNKSLTTSETYK